MLTDPSSRPSTGGPRGCHARPIGGSLWLLVALASACGDGSAPPAARGDGAAAADAPPGESRPTPVAIATDSSGITIRSTPAGALDLEAYRRSPSPSLRLDGTADGGEPFHAIGALAFGPDGSIAIAERGEMRVRIHARDGRRRRTVGREGQGPGEFGALNGLGFRGDSLLVFDSRWFRISVFDGEGVFVRQVEPRGPWGTRHRWASLAPDAGILTRARRPDADLLWGLHDFEGEPIRPLPELPPIAPPTLVMLGPSGASSQPTEPLRIFGARPGAGPFGAGFASFAGPTHEVRIHGIDGALREIWRVVESGDRGAEGGGRGAEGGDRGAESGGRVVTDTDIAAARQRALRSVDPERRPAMERRWSTVESPERFPALGSAQGFAFTAPPEILESETGELWVHGYPTNPDSRRIWWVFGRDGALRGSVSFPPRFELHAVGAAGALGIELDDFDVERVVLFALETVDAASPTRQ